MPPKTPTPADTAAPLPTDGLANSTDQGGASDGTTVAQLVDLAAGHAAAADKAADAATNALATTLETAERVAAMLSDVSSLFHQVKAVADQAAASSAPLLSTVVAVPGIVEAAARPLSELLQLVRRRTVLSVDGAPDRVIEQPIAESEVLSHVDHGYRAVVVTKDGQKHVWPAPQA